MEPTPRSPRYLGRSSLGGARWAHAACAVMQLLLLSLLLTAAMPTLRARVMGAQERPHFALHDMHGEPAATPSSSSGSGRALVAATATPRTCGTIWPWRAGVLDVNATPPWRPLVAPAGMRCDVPARPRDALARCVANRTIYILGNSVARGYFFELPVLLSNSSAAVSRASQQRQCTKVRSQTAAVNLAAASCTMYIDNTRIVFVWRQWFWDAPLGMSPESIAADMCSGATGAAGVPAGPMECLGQLLAEATERDALIMNQGLAPADRSTRAELAANESLVGSAVLADGTDPEERTAGAWPWWAAQTAALLRALPSISRIPLNRTILATTTRVTHVHSGGIDGVNAITAVANAVAAPAFLAAGARVVDQRAVNRGNERLYADATHFPGVLSRAFWHAALAELGC